jgi:hypothetical protein
MNPTLSAPCISQKYMKYPHELTQTCAPYTLDPLWVYSPMLAFLIFTLAIVYGNSYHYFHFVGNEREVQKP